MVRAGDVDICVETFGVEDGPTILLIAGASESMDPWAPDFCRRLSDERRFVIRYDHRDTGRSSSWPAGAPGYSGSDLGADAIALIDLVAGGRAHVVGVSMGGAIAQHIAVDLPDRVATLTLIATSPGPAADLPTVSERLSAAFTTPSSPSGTARRWLARSPAATSSSSTAWAIRPHLTPPGAWSCPPSSAAPSIASGTRT